MLLRRAVDITHMSPPKYFKELHINNKHWSEHLQNGPEEVYIYRSAVRGCK